MAEEISVNVILPEPKDAPPPVGANYFHFSFAGSEVQMMVGYVDPREVALIRANPERPKQLYAAISHRFAISPAGFAILRTHLEEIGKKYDDAQKAGEGAAHG